MKLKHKFIFAGVTAGIGGIVLALGLYLEKEWAPWGLIFFIIAPMHLITTNWGELGNKSPYKPLIDYGPPSHLSKEQQEIFRSANEQKAKNKERT